MLSGDAAPGGPTHALHSSLSSRHSLRATTTPPPTPQLYNARTLLVLSADAAPDALFGGAADGEEPIIDFEGLQFETAVEGEETEQCLGAAAERPCSTCLPASLLPPPSHHLNSLFDTFQRGFVATTSIPKSPPCMAHPNPSPPLSLDHLPHLKVPAIYAVTPRQAERDMAPVDIRRFNEGLIFGHPVHLWMLRPHNPRPSPPHLAQHPRTSSPPFPPQTPSPPHLITPF